MMQNNTSWEGADQWYDQAVGEKGHYYHQHVIFPALIPLLSLNSFSSPHLLDVACGQGVLARQLPPSVQFTGIDVSPSFIKTAQSKKNSNQHFFVGDVCEDFPFKSETFTHSTIILAFQNIAHPDKMIKEVSRCLIKDGLFLLVLNHPCFRIPRQSHWGIEAAKKLQYRRIDAYLSPLKIPIQVHPSKKETSSVWAFHYPLSLISNFLFKGGFVIELLEEWTSDKKSSGANAKMEDRARKEIPLFLAIKARKI